MNCDAAKNDFSLYLYGELDFNAEEALEQHLDGCPACRQAVEHERVMHRMLDEQDASPSPELLHACRRELRSRMATTQAVPVSMWRRIADSIRFPIPSAAIARPVAAMALLAVGFLGARVWDSRSTLAEPSAMRVRNLTSGPEGDIRLVLEEVREKTMTGRADDENIRRMLLAAAADPSDPGLRARTLDVLKGQGDESEVRRALLHALLRDPNAGVRLKAIEGLRPFTRDPETRRALSSVLLRDDNPGVRTLAIDMLVDNMIQTEMVGTLQELMSRESNPYIRQKSLRALRDLNASVETF